MLTTTEIHDVIVQLLEDMELDLYEDDFYGYSHYDPSNGTSFHVVEKPDQDLVSFVIQENKYPASQTQARDYLAGDNWDEDAVEQDVRDLLGNFGY